MIDPKIIEYIKYNLSQGKTREVITQTLLTQGGWTQPSIDEAFKVIESGVPVVPSFTPATPSGQIKYAGFWIRAVALMVDISIFIWLPFLFFGAMSYNSPLQVISEQIGYGVSGALFSFGIFCLMIILFFTPLFYFVLMTYYKGATLGKMLMGIKVQTENSEKLTWGKVILRETVGKMASSVVFNIGYIMAAFTNKKQALHDMVVSTVVVYKDPQKKNTTGIVVGVIVACVIPALVISSIFVVFASLNSARNKGNDAYVRTSMTNIRTQAQIYYDKNNSSYAGVCESTLGINNLIADMELRGSKAVCYDGTGSFSVSTILKTNNSNYCTDSSGFTGEGVSTKDGICIGDRTNNGDDSAITEQENPSLTDLQKKYLVTDESGVNKNKNYYIDFNKDRYYLAWSSINEGIYDLGFLKEKDDFNSFKEFFLVSYLKQDSTDRFQRYVDELRAEDPKLNINIIAPGKDGTDGIISYFINKADGGIEFNLRKVSIIDKNTVRIISYGKIYTPKEVQDKKTGYMSDLKANAGNWLADITKVDFKI